MPFGGAWTLLNAGRFVDDVAVFTFGDRNGSLIDQTRLIFVNH